jgi:hypothetical protein
MQQIENAHHVIVAFKGQNSVAKLATATIIGNGHMLTWLHLIAAHVLHHWQSAVSCLA